MVALSKKGSARASRDAGMGKREPALVLALDSLPYKEGWKERQGKGRQPGTVDGGRVADDS